jgi:chromosome transmission fidelity protein 18
LAGRLKEVAAAEDMRADLTALLALCKKTDNDIRSCLASLQFFRSRGRVLNSTEVADLAVGAKDSQKSLFSVWDEVFTVPRPDGPQRPAQSGAGGGGGGGGQAGRFKHVLETVSSCGEYDRVVTGILLYITSGLVSVSLDYRGKSEIISRKLLIPLQI